MQALVGGGGTNMNLGTEAESKNERKQKAKGDQDLATKRIDLVRTEGKRLIEAGVMGKAFPGGAGAIAFRYREPGEEEAKPMVIDFSGGMLGHGLSATKPTTFYDLASLTKAHVATAALVASEQGRLDLQAPAESILTDIRAGVANGASVEELFCHRAPLAAWGGLYLDVPHEPGSPAARRWILNEASRRPDNRKPGTVVYSDLGYMLAGAVLERALGQNLDKIMRELITDPLSLSNGLFYAGALPTDRQSRLMRDAAPTERDEWRDRMIRGEVHDENAAALGGVAGHAGLFGTAKNVALFGLSIVDSLRGVEGSLLKKETMEFALKERPGGSYVFGWDTRSETDSAARSPHE